MTVSTADLDSLLPRFGLSRFRPGQREVIEAVAAGEDVMCVMPTGGGKSLCYQLPTLAREGTTIVVSPLIALMKDQVDTLRRGGIAAQLINSTLTLREQEEAMEAMVRGELELLYVAPERLRNGRFLEMLAKSRITLLAIDEAHCVSEWGHDFRPDYARLGNVRHRYLNGLQTIALTATATPMVRDDICAMLGLQSPRVFVTGFARTNLSFGVTQSKTEAEKDEQLIEFVKQQSGAGIIYAATRKACESIGEWLPQQTRRPVGVYHGGMESEQRRRVQENFMAGKLDAIVATNAFGMGIDKSDIRYVAHYNMPGTLEAYYQEAGRAGRDGKDSECRLFFSYHDRYIQEYFIENRYPSKDLVRKVYEFLRDRPEDPIELTLEQVRDAINADSSEAIGTAETLLAKSGVMRRLDSSQNQMIVRIDSDLPTLLDLLPKEAKVRRKVVAAVEKVIGKRRHDDVFVRPHRLMEAAGVERDQLMRTMRELSRLNAFDYVPPFRGRAVHFIRRDQPFELLDIDFDELARRKASEYEKLEAVIGFARTGGCRQRVILDYFGDNQSVHCGRCDRCVDAEDFSSGAAAGMFEGLTQADADALICGLRVILSGVTRMHGRFGKTLVAQMLCGSQNKRISQWRLQQLSTYGMLSTMKQSQVCRVIDRMIDLGLVVQREVDQRRPTIEISELGKSVMHLKAPLPASFSLPRGLAKSLAASARHVESTDVARSDVASAADTVEVAQQRTAETGSAETVSTEDTSAEAAAAEATEGQTPPPTPSPANPSTASAPSSGSNSATSEGIAVSLDDLVSPEEKLTREITETLKRWRRRTSAALGLPAFRVLSNSTIDRLAQQRPTSSCELEEVPGIGTATMEQHGYDLLELIAGCVSENAPPTVDEDRAEGQKLPVPAPKVSHSAEADTPTPPATPSTDASQSVPAATGPARGELSPKDSGRDAEAEATSPDEGAPKNVAERDAYWTWRLFSDGFTIDEVCQIRRLNRSQIAAHLAAAARAGRSVSPSWQP